MRPYILGVDIGTGTTKSIAVDVDGRAFSVVKYPYPVIRPQPGFAEQDPELIWSAFINSISVHVEKLQQPPLAICLSSAMHSIIPVDHNGVALANMMTWADARSEYIATRLRASSFVEDLYRKTGTPLHALSPLCKIIWLRENNEALFNNSCKFISIKEFIWFKLFQQFKVDISIASAMGLFNIENDRWDKDALALAEITEEKLSAPVSTHYVSKLNDPSVLSLLSIPADVPFIIGASDGCLANLACNVINGNSASVTIGTSGAVRTTSKHPIHNFNAMTFNYKLDEDTFICGGAINNGGNVLQWYLKNLFNRETLTISDYDDFFSEAGTIAAGARGLLFLPYLNGERAPLWDTESCGTFLGLKQHHKRAHLSRAVIEGICYALNDVLLTLKDDQLEITQLHVSGGFVASETWVQMLADITGKKILIFHTDDASAIGAAYLGLKILGLKDDYNSLVADEQIKYVEPNQENHEVYKMYFNIFKSLYPILKETMHNLHNLDLQ